MQTRIYRNGIRFCLLTVAALMFLLTSKNVNAADSRREIWQSRDQFVAVERQDSSSDVPVAANDHPVELSLDRLTSILTSINVRLAENEKPGPLFTPSALTVLVPNLQKALLQSTPADDVVFAVFGLHDVLFGFAKSPKVTTGRLFYKSGKLNLIVGMVQQDVNERADRRLFPFIPGSRQQVAAGEWTLLTDAPFVRRDWMVFGKEWQAPVVAVPATVAEKKPAQEQVSPVQPARRHEDQRKPSERLATLNELKEKGLITDDEYRSKRLEILNGL